MNLQGLFPDSSTGSYTPVHAIRSVKDKEGNVLIRVARRKDDRLVPDYGSHMRNLLSDVSFKWDWTRNPLYNSYTGAKTGTTDHYKDLWVGGLNDLYTTAVWVGYDKPQPIKHSSDQKIHLRIFSALLRTSLKASPFCFQ